MEEDEKPAEKPAVKAKADEKLAEIARDGLIEMASNLKAICQNKLDPAEAEKRFGDLLRRYNDITATKNDPQVHLVRIWTS